ncbi:MAG: histidinol dehydrogenase, partial [Bacteroidales bacterium]|nr:histidinol dehydrogenase [Bacteroidales bacterium]
MNIIQYPERESWPVLLRRPELNHAILEDQVQLIIEDVAMNGDSAVKSCTKKFDGVDLD